MSRYFLLIVAAHFLGGCSQSQPTATAPTPSPPVTEATIYEGKPLYSWIEDLEVPPKPIDFASFGNQSEDWVRQQKAKKNLADYESKRRDAERAVQVLSDRAGKDCLPWILNAMEKSASKAHAQKVLLRLGVESPEYWVKGVVDDALDVNAREEAARMLEKAGKDAVPVLIENLSLSVASVLAKIGPLAIPNLIVALEDADPEKRFLAAFAIGEMAEAAEPAIPALTKATKDPTKRVCLMAVQDLGRMGPKAEAAIPALIEALHDNSQLVCETAVDAIARIGPAAVPSLIEDFQRKNLSGYRYSAEAAGKIRPPATEAIEPLLQAAKGTNLLLRIPAARGLLMIDPANADAKSSLEEATAHLCKAIKMKDAEFRRLNLVLLGHIGPYGKSAVPPIAESLKDAEAKVRSAASEALGKIGSDEITALAALTRAEKDPDENVRRAAHEALRLIKNSRKNN